MLSLYYALFQLLVFFAFIGIFVLLFIFTTLFSITINFQILALIAVIPTVLLLYFSSALYGSYIKHCNELLGGAKKTDFYGFFRYAVTNAGSFFRLVMAKILIVALFVLPLVALRLFVLTNVEVPYIGSYLDTIIYIMALGIDFIIGFIFSFPFYFVALYGQHTRSALGSSFRLIRKKHILALVFYAIYAVVLLTMVVPLLNLLTLFVTLPILVSAMNLFCQKAIGIEAPRAVVSKSTEETEQGEMEEKPQEKKERKRKKKGQGVFFEAGL